MVKHYFVNHTYIVRDRLPEILRELRKERKVSQAKLAEELGFDSGFIAKIELGTSFVSVETLVLLADYFGVTTDYLLGRE